MRRVWIAVCLYLLFAACTAGLRAQGEGGASRPQRGEELSRLNAEVVQLYGEGKFDEALPPAQRALELAEGSFGPNDLHVADALFNLAAVRYSRQEYDKAGQLYNRALPIYEAAAGPDAEKTVAVLNRLTLIAFNRRDYARAEKLSERVLEIAEKKYGPDNVETARALAGRAELYRIQGETKKAREAYARVLDIAEKSPPESLRQGITLSLVNYLGLLYAAGAEGAEAERAGKVLTVVRNALGPNGQPILGGVLNGKAVYRYNPEYPAMARINREQGAVIVQVLVDETGRVVEARSVGGSPDAALRQAAESAARRWRFTPTLLSGVPVKVSGTITFNFTLR